MTDGKLDLLVLVADQQMEAALNGILKRNEALGIRKIQFKTFRHPANDSGCYKRGHQLIRPLTNQYNYALVVFDKQGCGTDRLDREQTEANVEKNLGETGWENRNSVIVIDPELELWVWSDSIHVDVVLGWKDRTPSLREWLTENHYINEATGQVFDPKKALEDALRLANKSRSASIYSDLAKRVSLARCNESSFCKLRNTLRDWFPI